MFTREEGRGGQGREGGRATGTGRWRREEGGQQEQGGGGGRRATGDGGGN